MDLTGDLTFLEWLNYYHFSTHTGEEPFRINYTKQQLANVSPDMIGYVRYVRARNRKD